MLLKEAYAADKSKCHIYSAAYGRALRNIAGVNCGVKP